MMSESDKTHSETHFEAETHGPVYTGTGTQQNLFIVDWSKVLPLIRSVEPGEYTRIISALREIGQCQERVKELKNIHNLLHHLETALNSFELDIRINVVRSVALNISSVRITWEPIVRQIRDLNNFSKKVKFLTPPFVWLLDIKSSQNDFDDSLNEHSSDMIIHKYARDLLETCRDQMFLIDDQLKDEIDHLDKVSYYVLRSIDDSPTKS